MPHAYVAVVQARLDAYAAHMATMTEVPAALVAWAGVMTAKYGPRVGMHFVGNDEVVIDGMYIREMKDFSYDWLTALMVVRYGEEPDGAKVTGDHNGWPTSFSEDDVARAQRWAAGDHPYGVHYFPKGA